MITHPFLIAFKLACETIGVSNTHLDKVLEHRLDAHGNVINKLQKPLSPSASYGQDSSRLRFIKDMIWEDRTILAKPDQTAYENLIGIMQQNEKDCLCYAANLKTYDKFMTSLKFNIMRYEQDPHYAYSTNDDTSYYSYQELHERHLFLTEELEYMTVGDFYPIYDDARKADKYLFPNHVINNIDRPYYKWGTKRDKILVLGFKL